MHKIDFYIIKRLVSLTFFMMVVLIFIFIIIDFSENSDDFADKGATSAQIWSDYYLNYIPEMIRLMWPLAVFTACLILTTQLTERLEITALKASGVSLYRLLLPYMLVAFVFAGGLSYLDAYQIPRSNEARIAFEKAFIQKKSETIDSNEIFRQPAEGSSLNVNYYDIREKTAFRVRFVDFEGKRVKRIVFASRMDWDAERQLWVLGNVSDKVFSDSGYVETRHIKMDTVLSVLPQDLARTTSDVYQLSYPQAMDYINLIVRSGAGGSDLPKVQFYGRIAYPFSIILLMLIGFCLASTPRKGGRGMYIASGLAVSFFYLATMKILEPFGASGVIEPDIAVAIPHAAFALIGGILLWTTPK